MFTLFVSQALALNCSGLHEYTCPAVNDIQSFVNGELGYDLIDDASGKARFRPQAVYDKLEALRARTAGKCDVDGSAGAVIMRRQKTIDGSWGNLAGAEGSVTGTFDRGDDTFSGTFDGTASGAFGDTFQTMNGGKLAGDFDGGFSAGLMYRVNGNIWVALTLLGDCAEDTQGEMLSWARNDDAPSSAILMGGDPGEGLDLQGNLVHQVNARGPSVGDWDDEATAGVTITADQQILNWFTHDYGSSSADNDLETVMRSIRWTNRNGSGLEDLNVDASVTPGQVYKVQLLFGEQCCNRAFDIDIDGQRVRDQYNTRDEQGGSSNVNGSVLTTYFEATTTSANIRLSNDVVNGIDDNPILTAFTFEAL